jgi:hypothetical protein
MSGKKQKAAPSDARKAVKEPSRMEFPNLTARDLDAPEVQAVTMLDYEGSPVVTYGIRENRAKRSRGAS